MTRGRPVAAARRSVLARACVGLILLAVGLPAVAGAQPRTAVVPGQRQWIVGGWWRQAQGLPQDRVISLCQTTDGYLWVGTRGGAARFDGMRFTTWHGGTDSPLPEGEIFALLEPPDGGLWLGVYGAGLTRFKDGRFTTLTTSDGLVDNYIRSLAVGRDGALWIGTDRGLSRYRDGRFVSFHVKDGLAGESVRVVFADPGSDAILVGTELGLQRFAGNRFEPVVLSPAESGMSVEAITRDRAGRLWVGTSVGLFCLTGANVAMLGPSDGLSSRAVRAVHEDSSGRIWAATNKGLDVAELPSGGRAVFSPVVVDADVTTVFEDREHSIWVGYRGHGVARLQRSLFSVFDALSGLPASSATTVFQTSDGTMWAGVGTALSAIRGNHVDAYGVESGLPDRAVSSLAEDSAHRLWVGTESGLFRSASPIRCSPARCDARFVPVTGHPALLTHVRVLRADGDAAMLVGTTSDGLLRVPTPGASGTVSVLVPGEVRSIVRESASRLWVGLRDGGLAVWSADGTSTMTTRDGLASNSVQTLFLDREGTLWVGTRRGLSWVRGGKVAALTVAQGLWESHVYGITDDGHGRLWLSSGSGIFTLAKRDLHEYAAGRQSRVTSIVYGLEHGLPSTLCALSHDPVMTTDAQGRVWAATLGGVVAIDPTGERTNTVPPPVLLESVTIDGAVFGFGAPVEAPHGRGSLVFSFAAPSFRVPEKMVFRYRLEGFDPAWTDGVSREVRYTNIPPGHYRFTVLARNSDGVWSVDGASAEVHLVPRFYERAWFRWLVAAGLAFAAIGIGVGFHRVRVRRLQARERELARRVDESVAHIKMLRGLLPICAWCKRVRDDEGYWTQMEAYVRAHSQAEFSHGLCPDCLKENFPDDAAGLEAGPQDGGSGRAGV